MRVKKLLLLVLAIIGIACGDSVIVTTAPTLKISNDSLIFGYWSLSALYNCPANFTGIGDRPINGCVGTGLSRILSDSSVGSDGTMKHYIVVQTLEGDSCKDPANNTFSLFVSIATMSGKVLVYQISLGTDAMVYAAQFSDSNHMSGSISLAQAQTSVGSWKWVRLVPSAEEVAGYNVMFAKANSVKLELFRKIRAGQYRLP